MMGQLEAAQEQLARARELATRLGDRNLEAMAMVFQGTTLVMTGEVSEGLALLDEATARAVSGELDPLATGMVYCVTIHSCQTLGDCGRAAEWTTQANRWCDRLDVSGFPGACLIHRAEIMRLQGNWDDAEEQAAPACEELGAYFNLITSAGSNEIGEIRRRRGDFAQAEEAYAKANELGHPTGAQPGLALLRLAQGKVDSAAAAVRRALESEGLDPLTRASLLPAQVEIALAAGELARARAAATELEEIADQYRIDGVRTPHMEGTLQLTLGRIRIAERDFEGAMAAAKAARSTWEKVGAPYEAALARMLLGIVYRGEEDEHSARDEIQAAKATFERLGAALDTQRAAELLGEGATGKTFVFTDIVDSTKLLEALRRGEVAKAPEVARQAPPRANRGGRRRGHQADRGRLLRRVRVARGSSGRRDCDPARARRGADRARRADRRPQRQGLPHGGRRLHRPGRPRRGSHRRARRRRRDPREHAQAWTARGRFRLSEPRPETLKGFSEPVEVAAVEWR